MDEKTLNFLIQNNLGMLVEKFNSEEIDTTTLLMLTQDNLKELCPQLGIRVKLQQAIQQLQATAVNNELHRTTSTASTVLLDHDPNMSQIDDYVVISVEEDKNNETEKEKNVTSEMKDIADSNYDSNSNKRKLEMSSEGNKIVCKTNFFEDNVNLLEYLNRSSKGRTIIESYNKNSSLDAVDRRMLVHLVVDGLLDRHETVRGGMFLDLAKEIVQIFPTESVSTYYFYNGKISKNIKGKLCDRYKNERHYRQKNKPNTARMNVLEQTPLLTDDIQSKVNWLRNSQEPWPQVQQYWLQTYDVRHRDFISEKQLAELVNTWPLLKHPKGYTLIDLDFTNQYIGKTSAFIDNFPKHCEFLHQLISEVSPLTPYTSLDTEEEKCRTVLTNIGWLLTPVPFKTKTNSRTRPSRSEATSAFLPSFETCDLMTDAITSKQMKCADAGLTIQPQIYYVSDIQEYYVICDEIRYRCRTALKAVDISIKLHLVLNLRYDPICLASYTFLQKCIFKIDTDYDSVSPSLAVLMKKLEQHSNN